jgi:hypothetical protein
MRIISYDIKVDGNSTWPVHSGDRKTHTALLDLIFRFELPFMMTGI